MRLDNIHVGVDVDGVLAAHIPTICRELRAWKDVDFYPEDVSGWNSPIPGLDMHLGEAMHHLTKDPSVVAAMDPVDGASDGMQRLQDTGATVTIITHRKWANHDVTKQWLADHDIPYDTFADEVGPNVSKSTIDVDAHIDDYYKNLLPFAEQGVPSIMMLHQGNVEDIPDCDLIHVAGTDTHSVATLAENRRLQWDRIPELLAHCTSAGSIVSE